MAERLTSKPIPVSYPAWAREVSGVRTFLASLDAYEGDYGRDWALRVGSYYRKRLADLLAHRPASTRGVTRTKSRKAR